MNKEISEYNIYTKKPIALIDKLKLKKLLKIIDAVFEIVRWYLIILGLAFVAFLLSATSLGVPFEYKIGESSGAIEIPQQYWPWLYALLAIGLLGIFYSLGKEIILYFRRKKK